jgi:2-dehydropantoate 2-reductase
MSDLNWLIFGAGAIGTYIGGSLALQGGKVAFVEQPGVADELRQRGMRLELPDGEHLLPKPQVYGAIEQALEAGPYDVAVFALKSYDTQAALQLLAPYSDRLPAFLCLQNGVENEAALRRLLGSERVIPGTVTSAIGRRAAGDIVLERLRGMGVAGGHPLSAALAAELEAGGLNAHLFDRPDSMKWSKLLTNLLANAIPAILDMTPSQVLADPALYRLEIGQIREALLVMDALKIPAVNLPHTPVRLLALAARSLPAGLSQPLVQRVAGRGRGAKMPSLHIDLHSGRGKSEVDYLNGAVARFGQQAGVPTPVNRRLNDTLLALTRGELPPTTYSHNPKKLLDLV